MKIKMDEGVITTLFITGKLTNDSIYLPANSLLALFTIHCSKITNIQVICVGDESESISAYFKGINNYFKVNVKEFAFDIKFITRHETPTMIQNAKLPATYNQEELYCTIGLCSSLRHVLNNNIDSNTYCRRLLGFRGGCLQACAEVSVWTKFCEIEVIEMLNNVYFDDSDKQNIPINVMRLEKHFEHPPILHNALKRKQEILLKTTKDRTEYLELKKKKLHELPELDHQYAEGLDLSLADILLFVGFDLVFYLYSNIDLKTICPLVFKWYTSLQTDESISQCKHLLEMIKLCHTPIEIDNNDISIQIPTVPNESLYKSDPMRYQPRARSYTKQKDISNILDKLNNINSVKDSFVCGKLDTDLLELNNALNGLYVKSNNNDVLPIYDLTFQTRLDWKAFPSAVHPIEGQLPVKRLQRKCDQLESLVQVVLTIAQRGNIIVDFCAGGGHLGIILAYLLPNCEILLVENKSESLEKAHVRVKKLKLSNVQFYQCNLDYFQAKFDIGVCLHACGVATDLVLTKCINQNASFVASPCCYGSLRPNHILEYPRSLKFSQELKVDLSEYLVLGHAADQTHNENNPKTAQGKRCMQLIDYDRLKYAESLNFKTKLIVMSPPTCTPKNHILLGSYIKEN